MIGLPRPKRRMAKCPLCGHKTIEARMHQAEVVRMYLEGFSLEGIGREFNAQANIIQAILKDNGVETRKPGPIKGTRQNGKLPTTIKVLKLRLQGKTLEEIGKEYGVTKQYVAQFIDALLKRDDE